MKKIMSMKSKTIQILSILCAVVGVVGLGIEIFANEISRLTPIYISGTLVLVGLLGNAVCAIFHGRAEKGDS